MVTLNNAYQKASTLLWGTISPGGQEPEILQGWDRVLRYLASILGATGTCLAIRPTEQRLSSIPILETWPPGVVNDFFERGFHLHRMVTQIQEGLALRPTSRVYGVEELVPDYWKSLFAREMTPARIANVFSMDVFLDEAGLFVGELGFHFQGPTQLSPSQIELLEALAPMFAKTIGFYHLWWDHRLKTELLHQVPCTVDLAEDPYYFYRQMLAPRKPPPAEMISIGPDHISRVVPVGTFNVSSGPVTPCAYLRTLRPSDPCAMVPLLCKQGFSMRQAQVAAHLWSGMSQKQIAAALDISRDTVAYHLDAAYQKAGARGGRCVDALGGRAAARRWCAIHYRGCLGQRSENSLLRGSPRSCQCGEVLDGSHASAPIMTEESAVT